MPVSALQYQTLTRLRVLPIAMAGRTLVLTGNWTATASANARGVVELRSAVGSVHDRRRNRRLSVRAACTLIRSTETLSALGRPLGALDSGTVTAGTVSHRSAVGSPGASSLDTSSIGI